MFLKFRGAWRNIWRCMKKQSRKRLKRLVTLGFGPTESYLHLPLIYMHHYHICFFKKNRRAWGSI